MRIEPPSIGDQSLENLRERVLGSLLYDPPEKSLLLPDLGTYTPEQITLLIHALDREDDLLTEALKRDGPRMTALIAGYVAQLNSASCHVRRKVVANREHAEREGDVSDAERILSELFSS